MRDPNKTLRGSVNILPLFTSISKNNCKLLPIGVKRLFHIEFAIILLFQNMYG